MDVKTLSFTLREEHSCNLRVSANMVLRRILGPRRMWREAGEDYIMRRFITYASPSVIRAIE